MEGLPVDIIKFGNDKNASKRLLLIIPGNPGVVEYYGNFAKALYNKLNGLVDVWAMSHACHSQQKLASAFLEHHSPLEVEILHKLVFLLKEIPRNTHLILVGHSIGCFMIMSVLKILSGCHNKNYSAKFNATFPSVDLTTEAKGDLLNRIEKCYFLFPVIERMKDSPNGRKYWPILSYGQWFIVSLVTLIYFLPLCIKSRLSSFFLGSADLSMVEATVKLCEPRIFSNMLKLAHDELFKVNALDTEVLEAFKDRIVLYYGTKDEWCPLSYKTDLERKSLGVHTLVDELQADHAFVVRHSLVLANFLASDILNR